MKTSHLRLLLDAINTQVWSVSLDGVYQEANSAHARFVGRSVEALIGVQVCDVIPAHTLEPLLRCSREALKTGTPSRAEQWVSDASDDLRLLEVTQTPLRDAAGELVGLACSAEDITERHTTREALRRSEEQLRRVTNTIPGVLVRYKLDSDGNDTLLYASDQLKDLWGVSKEHALEDMKHAWGRVHPDDAEHTRQEIMRAAQHLTPTEHTWRMVMPDGAVKWLTSRAQPSLEEDGSVVWDSVIFDVTEHKRTQLQLESEKRRLSSVIRGTQAGTWEWNVQTGETIFNARWAEVIGCALEELEPTTIQIWIDHAHPEDLESSLRKLRACFRREREYYHHECRMRHQDGRWIWTLARGRVGTWTPDDKPEWMFGTFQDITAQKLAQAQLAEANMRMQVAADAARFGVWDTDIRTNTLCWDRWMFRLYGLDPEDFGGTYASWERCVHPDDLSDAQATIAEALNGDGHFEKDFRIITPSGQTRTLKAYARVVQSADGKPERLIGINYDITEKRKVEEELRFQSLVLESISDLVLAANPEGQLTYANAAARAFLNASSDAEALPEVAACWGHPVSDAPTAPNTIMQVALETGEWRGETRMTRQDGEARLMRVHLQRLHAPAGRVLGVIGVLADITDHKRAEEEVLRMQRLDGLGLIASGIAHDFNNMLMSMMGYLELAELDMPEGAYSRTFAEEAFQAIERARQLTRQLMSFAKGDEPVLGDIDTRSLIQETAAFHLHGSNVALRLDLSDALWPIHADKAQIGQVLSNLTINARQAMERGGTLHISAENLPAGQTQGHHNPDKPYVRITVRDEGEGMAPQTLSRVFDPYFTTKASGHGLGLTVVHTIVRKHEGHIRAASTPGVGTTFDVLLPASPSASMALKPPAAARAQDLSAHALRVLLMDDEATLRGVGVGLLEALGVACDGVSDGEEALVRYARALEQGQTYDAVIMDLTIVGGPGARDTIAGLLSLDPNARAIAMSGYASDPALAQYRDHGFVARLPKPFTLQELHDALLKAMRARPR